MLAEVKLSPCLQSSLYFEVASNRAMPPSISPNAACQATSDKSVVLSHTKRCIYVLRTTDLLRLPHNLRMCLAVGEIGLLVAILTVKKKEFGKSK